MGSEMCIRDSSYRGRDKHRTYSIVAAGTVEQRVRAISPPRTSARPFNEGDRVEEVSGPTLADGAGLSRQKAFEHTNITATEKQP